MLKTGWRMYRWKKRTAKHATRLANQGKQWISPAVAHLHDQWDQVSPALSNVAHQMKDQIPAKTAEAKEAASHMINESETVKGFVKDAQNVRAQLAQRTADASQKLADQASQVSSQAAHQVSEATASTTQALKKADKATSKASKKLSRKANKRAEKAAKKALEASQKLQKKAEKRQKKGHKGLIFFVLVALTAGAAVILYRRSQPVEDPWAEEYWEDIDYQGTSSTQQKAEKTAHAAQDQAKEAAQDAKEKASEVKDQAKEAADNVAKKATESVDKAVDAVKDAADKASK